MSTTRGSALWGKRTGGDRRGRTVSGKGTRLLVVAVLAATLSLLVTGVASPSRSSSTALVPQSLLDAAQANPAGQFSVVIQGDGTEKSDKFAGRLSQGLATGQSSGGASPKSFKVRSKFRSIDGLSASVSGRDILDLRRKTGVLSIVPDSPVTVQANPQKWPTAVAADWFLTSPLAAGSRAATIAIVDSGVDRGAAGLGTHLLKQVDLGGGLSNGDARGHGSFVAGVAAGNGLYRGVAPDARIVSLDVFDSQGQGTMSNVIQAADWILKNKDTYGIRVANFSLQTSQPSSFLYDPLDAAVERLWQAGIVVVASAGNYGTAGGPSGVLFAPGNDPFVITVGAVDINGSLATWDDTNAPWSAYGYTPDGFAKPEVSAPGRYMTEQIPSSATLLGDFPTNVLDRLSGTIQLSGTSFSAAVVSGVVADLLGVHPEWTPDQVKGALMLSSVALPAAAPGSMGVGEVNLYRALKGQTAFGTPPNPNAALEQFLVPDPAGGPLPVFDAQRWIIAASSNPSWNAAAWSSASWSSASWSSASWSSASWSSASWSSASWSSASWSSASWSSASWSNGADSDRTGDG